MFKKRTNMQKGNKRKARLAAGFVLVETIAAVAILLLAMPAALDTAMRGVSIGSYAKQELIATYLAQEGLEIIRAQRDQNLLSIILTPSAGDSWDSVVWDECKTACRVNAGNLSITACSGLCDAKLYVDANGVYGDATLSGGAATIFTRRVAVNRISANELQVTSTVTYPTPFGAAQQRSVVVSEYLYNWLAP